MLIQDVKKISLENSKCKIFENGTSVNFRALTNVAFCCSVYKDGVSGDGPKLIMKEEMNEHDQKIDDEICFILVSD